MQVELDALKTAWAWFEDTPRGLELPGLCPVRSQISTLLHRGCQAAWCAAVRAAVSFLLAHLAATARRCGLCA